MIKEEHIYVGIDLHKETHTAVILNCFHVKLGEITFANIPAEYPKLVRKVKKYCYDGKTPVYGLENAYGYGRPLVVWLIDKKCIVKDVNTAISNRQAKHRGAMYRKSDSDDAQAIALATINMLDTLPDACPNDVYWSLGQLYIEEITLCVREPDWLISYTNSYVSHIQATRYFLQTLEDRLHCISGHSTHHRSI